jgi:broad specificity phosphatase PhoE
VTRILLVRHAEALCNVLDVFAGHATCEGLSDHGRTQLPAMAAAVRALVDSEPVVVSSVMPRAVETAAAITDAFGLATAPALCGLCERHPGELEGMPNSEVRALDVLPDSVESGVAFLLRTRRALVRLAAENAGRTTIAVTHGGVIAASFSVFGGVDGRLPFRVRPANASVTEWSRCGEQWLLGRYNT